MEGIVCLITGSSSGLGKATAEGIVLLGATIITLSRDNERGRRAFEELRKIGGEKVYWIPADLSSLNSVRTFVTEFQSRFKRLDLLFNCAGTQLLKRETTVDGLEAIFATNYLGHFLLTNLLLSHMTHSWPSDFGKKARNWSERSLVDMPSCFVTSIRGKANLIFECTSPVAAE